jgi:hypothetical protein
MSQIASTMPEAKYRSTKKRARQIRHTSEFRHEVRELRQKPKAAKVEVQTQKASFTIASFWPVAVGVLLAGFAPEWHAMAVQAGIWAQRMTFPLSMLATHREIGIDDQMAAILPKAALYAQLPLDGLLAMLTLARGRSLKSVFVQLVLVHAVCAFVLWLISTNVS